MNYRNERQRIEAALPARMMYSVVDIGGDRAGDHAPTVTRLLALLKEAAQEPLDGLTAKDKGKLIRRIERAYASVSDQFEVKRLTIGETGPAVFFFVKRLVDSEFMLLFEGSPVALALELFMPLFEPEFRDDTKSTAAERHAAMALANLQAQGFYETV